MTHRSLRPGWPNTWRTRASTTFIPLLAALAPTLGCDSPGGGKSAIAPDVRVDATSSGDAPLFEVSADSTVTSPDATPDTTIAVDTSVPDTTVVDTTTTPDVTTSVCAQGCLPAIATAGPTVVFTQHSNTTMPPQLAGGAAPTGQWRLSAVDIYQYGTFVDGFEITISNEGDTRGRANFSGDAMQLSLFLDLRIAVDAFGTTAEDTGSANVAIGGCHSIDEPLIVGDLDACASGWAQGVPPPSTLVYATTASSLKLQLDLEPEFLISMLPPDQQSNASLVIVGPLTLVASLVRP